jgi:hypothetical protein
MLKKDWGGRKKTQIPGGKFVQIKKKCLKYPYCNQGDIKALKLTEQNPEIDIVKIEEAMSDSTRLNKILTNVANKHGISENQVKKIIANS